MSYFQSFSNCYVNNHDADDSSTVFDADTVIPDEVPSLPPLATETATATATTDYLYNNNGTMISSSPHSSQKESPATTISEFLRRINSQRSLAIPSTTAATRSEEILTNESSSSSSSKKRPITTNSSSHSSRKKTRQSSGLNRQSQKPDQSFVDKSDSEVEDENEVEDYQPDEAVINQSSSSSSQISTKQQQQNELRWKSKFEELRVYISSNNRNVNIPKSNKQLCNWVQTQRQEYKKFHENKKSSMTSRRIEILESIGFEWVSPNKVRNESKWNKQFYELKDYKEKYGDTNVPIRWKDNKQLGVWVSKQRYSYKMFKANKKSQITSERIDLLNSIGFEWASPNRSEWIELFIELSSYKELHGHTNVPQRCKDSKQLGKWVSNQRTEYKKMKANEKSLITPERVDLLNSIGFEWVCQNKGGGKKPRNESAWNKRFTELKAYKELHGHTNVPYKWKDNKQLGIWVNKQRAEYKKFKKNEKSQITPERMQMLESIGFQWSCRPDPAP